MSCRDDEGSALGLSGEINATTWTDPNLTIHSHLSQSPFPPFSNLTFLLRSETLPSLSRCSRWCFGFEKGLNTRHLAWVPDLIPKYIRYFSVYKSYSYPYSRHTIPYTHTCVYPIIAKYIHPITRPVGDRVPEYTRVEYSIATKEQNVGKVLTILQPLYLFPSNFCFNPSRASTRVKYPRGMTHTRVDLC